MTKSEYSDRVYGYLQKMKFDVAQEIDMLPDSIMPNQIAKAYFIAIVKDFIDFDNGRHLGFYISFSNDYQRIKKFHYTPPMGEDNRQTVKQ